MIRNIVLVLCVILLLAIAPVGLGYISVVSAITLVLGSTYVAYKSAGSKNIVKYVLSISILVFGVYVLAMPYTHYSVNQYDHESRSYKGPPHLHRSWSNDHIH